MKKATRTALWGIGSVAAVIAVLFQISEYQKRSEEESRLELQAVMEEDAAALAKCASKTLNAAGLKAVVMQAYRFSGFDFRKTKEVLDKTGGPPHEPYPHELTMGVTLQWMYFQEIKAVAERCGAKYRNSGNDKYWSHFWVVLENEPEFKAVLQKAKDENEAILSPYRKLNAAREEAKAEEQRNRMDALFKQNPAIE